MIPSSRDVLLRPQHPTRPETHAPQNNTKGPPDALRSCSVIRHPGQAPVIVIMLLCSTCLTAATGL